MSDIGTNFNFVRASKQGLGSVFSEGKPSGLGNAFKKEGGNNLGYNSTETMSQYNQGQANYHSEVQKGTDANKSSSSEMKSTKDSSDPKKTANEQNPTANPSQTGQQIKKEQGPPTSTVAEQREAQAKVTDKGATTKTVVVEAQHEEDDDVKEESNSKFMEWAMDGMSDAMSDSNKADKNSDKQGQEAPDRNDEPKKPENKNPNPPSYEHKQDELKNPAQAKPEIPAAPQDAWKAKTKEAPVLPPTPKQPEPNIPKNNYYQKPNFGASGFKMTRPKMPSFRSPR